MARLYIGSLVILLAVCLFGGCAGDGVDASGKTRVVATTPALAWIAGRIGGDDVAVESLLPAGTDAEHYEPEMSVMKRLGESGMLLSMQTPGFESEISEKVSEISGGRVEVADMSVGIERIGGSHQGGYDPHFLTSPANARKVVANVLASLIRAVPSQAREFESRAMRLDSLLAARDAAVRRILAGEDSPRSMVSVHPSLGYFSRDYGLRQFTLEENGKEPSPRRLGEKLGEAAASGSRVLVYERTHSPDQAASYAARIGVAPFGVDFNAADFADQYESLARAIVSSGASR